MARHLAGYGRKTVLFCACIAGIVWLCGCTSTKIAAPTPPLIPCSYTAEPIQVDAAIEDAWSKAPVISPFLLPRTNVPATTPTHARMLWDDTYLYVLFEAWDQDIWAYHDERDQLTCRDDVLEVFVKPDLHGEGYANFEINVLETVYDAYAPREATPMGQRWKHWNCEGLQIAASVDGSLNNYHDQDTKWILEVAIPFASLPPCNGKAPSPGTTWRLLLARYDYSIYLEKGLELSSPFPLTKPNFHVPDEWGFVTFVR